MFDVVDMLAIAVFVGIGAYVVTYVVEVVRFRDQHHGSAATSRHATVHGNVQGINSRGPSA